MFPTTAAYIQSNHGFTIIYTASYTALSGGNYFLYSKLLSLRLLLCCSRSWICGMATLSGNRITVSNICSTINSWRRSILLPAYWVSVYYLFQSVQLQLATVYANSFPSLLSLPRRLLCCSRSCICGMETLSGYRITVSNVCWTIN
jgi:hypothetical protein